MIRAAAFAVLLLAVPVLSADRVIVGRVVAVADGDTLTVLDADKTQHKVRLAGIDAPEKKQAFGTKAREALASLVFEKTVRVTSASKDRYGRLLGKVAVGDVDVSLRMVRDGFAWQYRQFDKSQALADAEAEARAAKRGLWADKDQVPPWEFRKKKSSRP